MALGVVVILGSVALPAFTTLLASNRRVAATNKVIGAMQYARGEAIKRAREVVLCGSSDGLHCASGEQRWSTGYLVFINEPPGPPYRVSSDAQILWADRWPHRVHVAANRDVFVFRPLARRATNGTVRICEAAGRVPPRTVIVSSTGRPRAAWQMADGGQIPCPDPDG